MNAIEFNNISKQYRLGQVSTGMVSHDLSRWWAKFRGKEDPYLRIGEINDRSHKGTSDYVWALQDINFKVEQGDVVGIIGKNGAGKSTLLKILSKITAPTTGEIRARGRIASLLEVGTGFHPEMTGRENIYLNGAIMGMTRSEITRKLDEIVDFAGVERYLDTPVKRYSSGMMVRLGFAVAAHLEPEILIVDEVLAVGDAEFQKKAIGKMQEVSRGVGRTVLFVSHNMGAVLELCNRGIVLSEGFIAFNGSVTEAVDMYIHNAQKYISKHLTDNISYKTNLLHIDDIQVNGSTDSTVYVSNTHNRLHLKLKGRIEDELKMAVEIVVLDEKHIPLAFYSPNQISGETPLFRKGNFEIEHIVELPQNMSHGRYFADISITNPFVEVYAELNKCLIIDCDGFTTKTGFQYKYSRGQGWLILQ